jgi:predicted negative regulator of RcsB-dependent stress response
MKHKASASQSGFAVIEITLIIVAVLAVAAVGTWVYMQRSKTTVDSSQSSQSVTNTTSNKPSQNVLNSLQSEVVNESKIDESAASNEATQAASDSESVVQMGESINAANL